MHNQFRAQLTGYNRVLDCLLEKQLQMLLTRGGTRLLTHGPPHSPLPHSPLPLPCPGLAPWQITQYWPGRHPRLLPAAPTHVAMMYLTSSWVSHRLPSSSFFSVETEQRSREMEAEVWLSRLSFDLTPVQSHFSWCYKYWDICC